MKLLVRTLGLAAGLLLSGTVSALGLGNINVMSALGEPLKANISVVSADKTRAGLSAQLASPEVFKGAGMDYPSSLPKLKFTIEARANGEPYIRLSTDQPVNDPFVSILVELSSPSGRLLREYTFLLDPPGFRSESSRTAVPNDVHPIEPVVETEQAAAIETAAPPAAPVATPPRAPEPVAIAPAAERKAEKKTVPAGSNIASGTIEVRRGDTLSEIASDIRPSGVSLERMLVALYRANAGSFDSGNMNRLRTGKILRQPDPAELASVTQDDAVQEIRAQTADWDAYRQKLASAAAPSAQADGGRETSGKISTTVADKAPPVKEGATEVVRLSKGEAPGNKTGGMAQAAQDRIHALEEEAIARDKLLKESNERIAALEKNIRDMQRLLELKSLPTPATPSAAPKEHPLEAPLAAPASAPVAASAVATDAASAVAAASAVEASKKPPKRPPVVVPPPSLLDEILSEPLYLGGLAAALLALIGGLVFARRKKAETPPKAAKAQEEDGKPAAPVAPSPEVEDFTLPAETLPAASISTDDVDPISEAELFLSFGRDVQAEEILKDALEKDPTNNRIRLNLLTIYENRKDAASFDAIARGMHDSGDAAAWTQAAEMGHRLAPHNPLYASAAAGITPPPAAAPATGLDFDIGLEAQEEASAAHAEQAADIAAAALAPMDISLDLPAAEIPPTPSPERPVVDLDFDLGSLAPETPAPQAAAATAPAQESAPPERDSALDFSLDFPREESKEPADALQQTPKDTMPLPDIDLTLDDAKPAAAEEAHDAHWHDVATKLDLAKAYQEMGDSAGAREILEEVISEGDAEQKTAAQAMLAQLP